MMAFRQEEVKVFKTFVICDDCGKETLLLKSSYPLGFESRMNGALHRNYTFKDNGNGSFNNYCEKCKSKHS